MEEADERFEEALALILKSWTSNERFSHHGKYWNFENIIVEPPTAQKPHPPIWMAAGSPNLDPQGARSAATICCSTSSPHCDERRALQHLQGDAKRRAALSIRRDVGVARAFYVAKDADDKGSAVDASPNAAHAELAAAGRRDKSSMLSFAYTPRGERGERAIRQSRRDRSQAREAARHGRGIRAPERRRHVRDNLRRFAQEVMPAFRTEPEMRATG